MKPCCVLCMLIAGSAAMATEHFVAPNGKADAAGTLRAPWNMAQANAAARPGDVVTFLPGDYEGVIEPAASGEAGKPITFRSQKPLGARLVGGTASDGQPMCLRLQDKQHLVISGFDLCPTNHMWLQMSGCHNVRLAGLRMQQGRRSYVPALVKDCHYCRFEDLDISRAVQLDANGHVNGNMFQLNASTHNVIARCRFSQAGHCPCCLWIDSTHNVLRGCVFDNRWGRNFELFTAPHTLFEGCVITNGYHGSGSADGRAKLFIWEGIFRRNLICRNWYQPLTIHAYKYGDMDPFGMANSRLYHNTFFLNYESGFEMFDIAAQPDPHMVRGNVLQNNLFARNDPGGDGVQLNLGASIGADNRFVSNLFWNPPAGSPAPAAPPRPGAAAAGPGAQGAPPAALPSIRYAWPQPIPERPQSSLRTAAEANRQLPAQFAGNRDGDPKFADTNADDYRLQQGSAARDAGTPLTVTTAAGASDTVPVADARPFYDGFGIPGEVGDLVFIGPKKQPARVVQVDDEASTLKLDRQVTFKAGDAVTLPYVGQAPDIGAYEAGAERERWYTAPHPTPALRIPTLGTATAPIVRTGFETDNLEEWFYWWYTHRQRNAEARIDDTTAATGKRSLRLAATDDKSTLSCLLQPPWWDLDRFPMVRFSYRIPPGVPVGIRLDAMQSEQRGSVMYVGGTTSRNNGGCPDLDRVKLMDDDQWHEATVDVRWLREAYPGVKLLRTFWFYTNANGKKGQQFWLDDFRIERQ
ncbi:right-handed parallel beta-helix repeat-containing protein [bacterium]|nr:right-handed parallel beta-helix repeat-containing protein [bacterium]